MFFLLYEVTFFLRMRFLTLKLWYMTNYCKLYSNEIFSSLQFKKHVSISPNGRSLYGKTALVKYG